jgi:hypothetical protein
VSRRGHNADAGHESRCFVAGENTVYRDGLDLAQHLLERQGARLLRLGQRRVQVFRLLEPQRLNPSADVSRLGCRRVHFCPRVGGFEFGQSAQVVHVVVRDDHPGQLPQGNALSPGGLFEQRQKTGVPAIHQDPFRAIMQQHGVQSVFPAGKRKIQLERMYLHAFKVHAFGVIAKERHVLTEP